LFYLYRVSLDLLHPNYNEITSPERIDIARIFVNCTLGNPSNSL
jgi:hypothetical protein